MKQLELALRPVIGGLVILVALIFLIGTAIKNPQPHDIPVGLVGPAQATQQLATSFGTAAPGAFQFTTYASEQDARAALDARTVDGVLLLGQTPHLVVAGAAGDAATGVMTAAFTNAFQAQGAALTVETVHPFASGDAHGLILFFVVVATFVSTLAVQAVMLATNRNAGLAVQAAVVVGYAALAGLAGMGTAAWIAGGYGDGFWTAAALAALASAAVGAVAAGCARLIGAPGLGLAGLVAILLSLVTSGGPVGSRLLPDFYRALAPWMPAGQLYDGMRGALFFESAPLTGPIAVLTGWLVAGLALMLLGAAVNGRSRKSVPAVATAH